MLLIYPPAARSAEPPLGLARLTSVLRARGREVVCLDLCHEGIEFLLGLEVEASDSWTRGALRRRGRAAASLRDESSYANPDRYSRAVGDLDRALQAASVGSGAAASLADYHEELRTPLRRLDLIDSAKRFEDNVFLPLFEKRVAPALAAGDGLVGISICYLSQALCAFALVGFIKAIAPNSRIILGGGLIGSWAAIGRIDASETFGGLVEAVLPGPAEHTQASFLAAEGRPVVRGFAAPPDFDDFSEVGYFAPKRIVPFNFSYGCPWKRCTFCPETAEDAPYRALPAPTALNQLRFLAERYEPGLFHFTDNEISPLYLRAVAESPTGIPWYGFARFSRALLEPGFCDTLAASGCAMLQLGLESGDQGVLDALGKGTRLEEISEALRLLSAASIGVYLYVLFGTPAENRASALRTRDFILENAARIDFLNVAVFNLPVTSPEARTLETRDFYEGDLSLYRDFRHPEGFDRASVREFLASDFALPEIRAITKRTPPIFTSSHAPFFLRRR